MIKYMKEKPSNITCWKYKGIPILPEDLDKIGINPKTCIGFVYKIINKDTGRVYIGKKLFFKPTYKTINKKRKKILVQSDWNYYTGSCDELNKEIATLRYNYDRIILKFCKTKGSLNYSELKYQILEEVIESDLYYNNFVGGKIHGSHVMDKNEDVGLIIFKP